MAPKSQGNSKRLQQTTLFDSSKAPRVSSSLPTPKRKRRSISKDKNPSGDSDGNDAGISSIKFTPKKLSQSASNNDDGAAAVVSSPKKRKTIILDSDDSDHVVKPKRLLKEKSVSRPSDDYGDGEQPKRRKLKKKRDIALVSSTDDEDLAEEVEKKHIIQNRLRTRGKKTAFQKSLEKLKRRKQGKRTESSSSDEDSSSSDNEVPLKGAMPSSDYDSLFDEDSEDNFIVEDDNPVVALPMEFSMESHEDLDYQFKKIFQFFVHIAVRPAKERHYFMKDQIQIKSEEQYFSMPLQMVRRKLSGLRDSLVASSVWRPDFKKSLATYPTFELTSLDFAVPSCDACHLGGRMSTLIGRLSGFPYDPLGWEIKVELLELTNETMRANVDLQDKEKSYSSQSDSKGSDDDSDDRSKKETSTVEFHLGRFCARRVRVYHEFTHWEYSLFKCIRDEVDELHENRQSNGFFRIAYAGGKKPPKDLDDADGICDWLDQRKVIDMEWMKIKDMMESARHLELEKSKGDDD